MAAGDNTQNANVVLTANTTQYSQQMTAAQSQTNSVTDSVVKLINAVNRLTTSTGKGLVILGATGLAGIATATIQAARFESQLGTLQARAAITGRSMSGVERGIENVSRKLPVATGQVAALATSLSKIGADPRNLEKLTEVFVKLSGSTGEDMTALAQGMTQLQQQMGTGAGSTEKYANSLAALSANLGTSATGTLQFAQSIAPVARSVGATQTEVLGLSAAFSKSGQDGFTAANVFTKLLTDINDATRYGSPSLTKYANLVGVTTEQFKQMGATDQVTAIFDSINKAGPDAAKQLDQLGISGVRAQRAIQGVAQQSGGLRSAVSEAQRGFNGDSLNTGSKAAFDGLNDELTKLRSNLASIGRDFGQAFLPGITLMVKGLNSMASAAASVMKAISPLVVAVTTLGGALGAIGSGTLLTAATGLGTLAAIQALRRNGAGAGFRQGRNERYGEPVRSSTYRRSISSFEEGQGGRYLQRPLYRAGQFLGTYLPTRAAVAGIGSQAADRVQRNAVGARIFGARTEGPQPAPLPRGGFIARGAMAASVAAQGVMGFARTQLDPLQPRAMRDITQRGNPAAFVQDGQNQLRSVLTGQGASLGNALRGSVTGFVALNRSLAGAAVGITQLGVRATAAAAAQGIRGGFSRAASGAGAGLARAGSGALALAGGPAGLALIAGFAGFAAYSNAKQAKNDFGDRLKADTGGEAGVNKYNEALGLATKATTSFADALNQATGALPNPTASQALQVSDNDRQRANTAGRELTNKNINDMSTSQALAYAGGVLQSKPDPKVIDALKLDLIQKFGNERGEQVFTNAQAQGNQYNSGGIIGVADRTSRIPGTNIEVGVGKNEFKTSKETQDAIASAVANARQQNTEVLTNYGAAESGRYRTTQVNQFLDAISQNKGAGAAQTSIAQGIETLLGGGTGSLDLSRNDLNKIQSGKTQDERTQAFLAAIRGTESGDRYIAGLSGNESSRTYIPPTIDPNAPVTELQKREQATQAGALFRSQSIVGSQLQTAAANPADANMQASAAKNFAAQMLATTGTITETKQGLQKLIDTIGDADDPMSQLAQAALAAAGNLQAIQNAGTARTSAAQNQDLVDAQNEARYADPKGVNYEANLKSANDAATGAIASGTQRLAGMVQALRSFNTQQANAQEDFNKSRSRQEEDYALQRRQSDQDYNQSRERSQRQFDLSRKRGEEDYQRSRQRTADDFNKSVMRSNEDQTRSIERSQADFDQSRARGQRDYDLARQQSQDDFNLSRMRSEEDYQHNIVVMTSQSAKAISDIYKRTASSPTWSASSLLQNAQRQNRDMAQQQANLATLRGAGVSGDTISQLGLNDPKNARQAGRMVADLAKNPMLVQEWNKAIAGRLDLAKAFVTDQDSDSYKEMEYQFNKTAERAQEDFDRMAQRGAESYQRGIADMIADYKKMTDRAADDYKMSMDRMADDHALSMKRMADDYATSTARGAADYETMTNQQEADYVKMLERQDAAYAKSVERTVADWTKSVSRAKESLNTSFLEVTGTFGSLAEEAMKSLSGTTEAQVGALATSLELMAKNVKETSGTAANDINAAMSTVFTTGYFGGGGAIEPGRAGTAQRAGGGTERDTVATAGATMSGSGLGGITGTMRPVNGGKITSGFGRRTDPVTGEPGKMHNGLDFGVDVGTPVMAARSGRVIYSGAAGSFGNLVKLAHGNNTESWYGHLSSDEVSVGQTVSAGQKIANSGNTGKSTGPHLHFQIMMNGSAVDPKGFLQGLGSTGVAENDGGVQGSTGTTSEKISSGGLASNETRNGLLPLPNAGSSQVERLSQILNEKQSMTDMFTGMDLFTQFPLTDANDPKATLIYEAQRQASNKMENDKAIASMSSKNPYIPAIVSRAWDASGMPTTQTNSKTGARNGIGTASFSGSNGDSLSPATGLTATGENIKGNSSANRSLGQALAAARGWTGAEWTALDRLWVGESGWNNRAQNPTSTAYGIAQFLNSTWATVGATKTSDPGGQIAAGLKYIAKSYGDPSNAYAKWNARSPHWYADGGIFTGAQQIGIGEHGSEAVLPLNQQGADFMAQTLAKFATYNAGALQVAGRSPVQASTTTINHTVDNGVNVSGPITVQAQDPNAMARALEAKARLDRLTKPAGK